MKLLVACEESQVVTKEFRKFGHEAYSCDIQPCSGGHPEWHLQQDVTDLLKQEWDMIIMHPPCTCLSVSGNSTYAKGMLKAKNRIDAVKWTQSLWDCAIKNCDRVCMENPVGVLNTSGVFPKPQYIQPYNFGHTEQKKTGLWLYGLPKLIETDDVYETMMKLPKNKRERLYNLSPSKNRAKLRSKTYLGIAKAMAYQWGTFL